MSGKLNQFVPKIFDEASEKEPTLKSVQKKEVASTEVTENNGENTMNDGRKQYTEEDIRTVVNLAGGELFAEDIAEKAGISTDQVRWEKTISTSS